MNIISRISVKRHIYLPVTPVEGDNRRNNVHNRSNSLTIKKADGKFASSGTKNNKLLVKTTKGGTHMKKRMTKLVAMGFAAALTMSAMTGMSAFAADRYESVTLAANQDVATFNPWAAGNSSRAIVGPALYETLGAYDTFGGTFYGVLMKEWEKVDSKTYRITLWDNIVDSEGNAFTASDVKFSMEKCWEKGELAETAIVESVTVVDDLTAELVFKADCGLGDFESVMYNIYMVTEAAFTASEDEMTTTPVGTGAYRLSEYVTGSSVTLEARDDYWQSDENKVVPTQQSNVQTIKVDVITESSQLATALQTGAIAATDSIEGESATIFLESADFSTYTYVDANGRSAIANVSEESPLHDENLRKAVFYALDQDSIVAFVNGGNNVPLATFGSTSYADYQEDWNDTNFPYDVELAKEYLAQSEYAGGVTLQMNVIQGKEADEECALVIQEQLAQIGIDLQINIYPVAQYLPLQDDPSAWDIMVNGFPTYTGYLANAWQKYFDLNTIGSDKTKNFLEDAEFQTLMETALNPDTYGEDAYDAVVYYLQDNAILKGLYAPTKSVIYNNSIVEEVALDQANYLVPGAFVYAE